MRQIRKLFSFKAFFFVLSFLIVTKFNIDPDLGWHIVQGQKFLQTGQIVSADPFSWTMNGYIWGNYFFLYDVLVAFLFGFLPYILVPILFGLVSSYFLVLLLSKKVSFFGMLASLLGVCLLIFSLSVRPSNLTLVFFVSLFLFLIQNRKRSFKSIGLIFLLFVVWANVHQGFVMGLCVLLGFSAVDYLKSKSSLKFNFLLFLGAVCATFITPFGFHLWRGIILDVGGSKTWSSIAEWQPTVVHFPANLFLLSSGIVFIYVFLKNFKKADPAIFMLGAFLFAFAFIVANTLVFWAVVFIYIAGRYVDFKISFDKFSKIPIYFSFVAIFFAFLLNFLVGGIEALNLNWRLYADRYPVAASEYIIVNNYNNGVLNDYAWGGYLIWQRSEIPVFIDGRMTGWRQNNTYILSDYLDLVVNHKCDVLKKYEVKTLLLKSNESTTCFSDFASVYDDGIAKVLVRNNL